MKKRSTYKKPSNVEDNAQWWKIKPKSKPKVIAVNNKKKRKKGGLSADHLRGESYAVFMASDYWKAVRMMVLKRDNFQCVICKSTELLQVHHDTYKHHFNEHKHLKDLMTLCRACHQEHHFAQL